MSQLSPEMITALLVSLERSVGRSCSNEMDMRRLISTLKVTNLLLMTSLGFLTQEQVWKSDIFQNQLDTEYHIYR